jgi:hypothetical protein
VAALNGGHVEAMKILIEKGVSLDEKDEVIYTHSLLFWMLGSFTFFFLLSTM